MIELLYFIAFLCPALLISSLVAIFPFLTTSRGFSHSQAKLSHSRRHRHGYIAALNSLFGKAGFSQPQPHQAKLWQHYFELNYNLFSADMIYHICASTLV